MRITKGPIGELTHFAVLYAILSSFKVKKAFQNKVDLGEAVNKLHGVRVLVIGDVMLDRYIWGEVQRISPEAPVPVIRVREESEVLGGAGHVAANLAGLKCLACLFGVRGTDDAGERLASLLEKNCIEEHLILDPSRPTITKTRIVGNGQQLLRIDEEVTQPLTSDLNERFKALVKQALSQCRAVILSDYGKGAFQTLEMPQFVIKLAREHRIPVLVDPKGKHWERYKHATCLTPNKKELEEVSDSPLADEKALLSAALTMRKRLSIEWLLVTLGRRGMLLVGSDDKHSFIPAMARDVYDVSGAGDTVIATLAAGISSGLPFPEAARLANIAASIVVGELGTQPVNLSQLKAILRMNNCIENNLINSGKVLPFEAACLQLEAWRGNGEKIVFTNGCFDLLHPGHIKFLHQARALGSRLIIGLNADVSVRRLKGPKRPILSEEDRAALLGALECVDLIVLFDDETPIGLIEAFQPDLLVKGADYSLEEVVGRNTVEAYGGEVVLLPLLEGFSTKLIIERVNANSKIRPIGNYAEGNQLNKSRETN